MVCCQVPLFPLLKPVSRVVAILQLRSPGIIYFNGAYDSSSVRRDPSPTGWRPLCYYSNKIHATFKLLLCGTLFCIVSMVWRFAYCAVVPFEAKEIRVIFYSTFFPSWCKLFLFSHPLSCPHYSNPYFVDQCNASERRGNSTKSRVDPLRM